MGTYTRAAPGGTYVSVRVQPRARRNRVGEEQNGRLKVYLTAPPVEGAANKALIAFLADVLDLPKRDVALVRGARGREKVIFIHGLQPQEVERRFARAMRR